MRKRAHAAGAPRARRTSPPRARRGSRLRHEPPRSEDALALPPECTLAQAETLKLRLTSFLRTAGTVRVDVSGVRRIDTASMQLLAAFARDRRSHGLDVSTVGASPVFDEAVRLLGLASLLAAPAAAASRS